MEKVLINKNLLVLHLRHFFFVVFIAGIAIFICIYQKESFRNSSQTPHLLRSSQKQTQQKNMVPFKATFVVTQEVLHTSTLAAGAEDLFSPPELLG